MIFLNVSKNFLTVEIQRDLPSETTNQYGINAEMPEEFYVFIRCTNHISNKNKTKIEATIVSLNNDRSIDQVVSPAIYKKSSFKIKDTGFCQVSIQVTKQHSKEYDVKFWDVSYKIPFKNNPVVELLKTYSNVFPQILLFKGKEYYAVEAYNDASFIAYIKDQYEKSVFRKFDLSYKKNSRTQKAFFVRDAFCKELCELQGICTSIVRQKMIALYDMYLFDVFINKRSMLEIDTTKITGMSDGQLSIYKEVLTEWLKTENLTTACKIIGAKEGLAASTIRARYYRAKKRISPILEELTCSGFFKLAIMHDVVSKIIEQKTSCIVK